MNDRQILVTLADGSQILVWLWAGGDVEVNLRENVDDTWRPVRMLGGETQVIELATQDGSRVAS